MKANHRAVAENAAAKAVSGTISYQQQDCQAFVEGCIRDCGGRMNYSGSNDMYRHTAPVCDIVSGRPLGTLLPGDLLFIHAFDGGEPAKYRGDGGGNASHVGLYCGLPGCEVAHSSASRGRVCPSTLKNGWTHARRAGEIGYETQEEEGGDAPMAAQKAGRKAMVTAPDGNPVKLRATPDTTKPYLAKVPVGTAVEVLEQGGEWCTVQASVGGSPRRGYMMARFLALEAELEEGEEEALFGLEGPLEEPWEGAKEGAKEERLERLESLKGLEGRVDDLERLVAWLSERLAGLEGGGLG